MSTWFNNGNWANLPIEYNLRHILSNLCCAINELQRCSYKGWSPMAVTLWPIPITHVYNAATNKVSFVAPSNSDTVHMLRGWGDPDDAFNGDFVITNVSPISSTSARYYFEPNSTPTNPSTTNWSFFFYQSWPCGDGTYKCFPTPDDFKMLRRQAIRPIFGKIRDLITIMTTPNYNMFTQFLNPATNNFFVNYELYEGTAYPLGFIDETTPFGRKDTEAFEFVDCCLQLKRIIEKLTVVRLYTFPHRHYYGGGSGGKRKYPLNQGHGPGAGTFTYDTTNPQDVWDELVFETPAKAELTYNDAYPATITRYIYELRFNEVNFGYYIYVQSPYIKELWDGATIWLNKFQLYMCPGIGEYLGDRWRIYESNDDSTLTSYDIDGMTINCINSSVEFTNVYNDSFWQQKESYLNNSLIQPTISPVTQSLPQAVVTWIQQGIDWYAVDANKYRIFRRNIYVKYDKRPTVSNNYVGYQERRLRVGTEITYG